MVIKEKREYNFVGYWEAWNKYHTSSSDKYSKTQKWEVSFLSGAINKRMIKIVI